MRSGLVVATMAMLIMESLLLAQGTRPATTQATPTIDSILSRMPQNLEQKQNETPRQTGERSDWLKGAVQGQVVVATVQIASVSAARPEGEVRVVGRKGTTYTVIGVLQLDEKVYAGDTITIQGKLTDVQRLMNASSLPAFTISEGKVTALVKNRR